MSDALIISDPLTLPFWSTDDYGTTKAKVVFDQLQVNRDGSLVRVSIDLAGSPGHFFTMPAHEARHFAQLVLQAADRAEAHVAQ